MNPLKSNPFGFNGIESAAGLGPAAPPAPAGGSSPYPVGGKPRGLEVGVLHKGCDFFGWMLCRFFEICFF